MESRYQAWRCWGQRTQGCRRQETWWEAPKKRGASFPCRFWGPSVGSRSAGTGLRFSETQTLPRLQSGIQKWNFRIFRESSFFPRSSLSCPSPVFLYEKYQTWERTELDTSLSSGSSQTGMGFRVLWLTSFPNSICDSVVLLSLNSSSAEQDFLFLHFPLKMTERTGL